MIAEVHTSAYSSTQNSTAFSDIEKKIHFSQCIITSTEVWQMPLKQRLTQLKKLSCSRLIYLLVFQQLFNISCS